MAVSGHIVRAFSAANFAMVTDVPLHSDYPHTVFEVIAVEDGCVTLRDQHGVLRFPIQQKRGLAGHAQEFVTLTQSSAFEKMMRSTPRVFEVRPFRGERM